MNKKFDYLIVGSGLFGAAYSWCARQAGKTVLVVDKRDHLGGNVYCENIHGINVHKYGPHVFHTSSQKVWDFMNQFVKFNRFTMSTIANYKGEIYNLPFNMNTFYQMWRITTPMDAKAVIKSQQYKGEIHNLEEQALSLVGQDIYEKLIKGYTEKQWGMPCCQLPSFIIRRLPVRFTYDNNYFNDPYQGIPTEGYNMLIKRMLEGIETKTEVDFFEGLDKEWKNIANKLVYTGKIDDFYNCRYGQLHYRSLRFENEIKDTPNYQAVAVMNFTDKETPFTRVIEHKHFETFGNDVYQNPITVISREYPSEYTPDKEAYYPINNERNDILYTKYKQLADNEPDIIFGGRLAEYKYYDMDCVIESALNKWKEHAS